MPEVGVLLSAGVALASLVGVILAYTKRKPGERQAEVITVGEAQINIATGTVRLAEAAAQMQREIAEQFEEQVKHLREETGHLRDEVSKCRTLIGDVTGERDALRSENGRLLIRIAHLEGRVRSLEGGAQP